MQNKACAELVASKSIGTLFTRDWDAQPFSTRNPNDKILRVFQREIGPAQ